MRSNVFGLVLVVLLAVTLASCGGPTPQGPTGPQGTVTASVVAADTGALLTAVAIQACRDGACVTPQTTRSDDGRYSFTLPSGSGYEVRFTRAGYLPATYRNVSVETNRTTHLEQLLLVNESLGGFAPASGRVVNAINGFGIPNTSVELRSGLNTTTGAIVATATTDGSGFFAFEPIAAGYYTAEVAVTGFVTAHFTLIVLGGDPNADQNYALAPEGGEGLVQVVLTWGSTPEDLDLHMTGPSPFGSGNRIHVYYVNKVEVLPDFSLHAVLDFDNTDRFGPETITLYERLPGSYRFFVHDYSNGESTNSRALADSRAAVRVYVDSFLVQTFHVPGSRGTLWTVFELSGTTITVLNTMSYIQDEDLIGNLSLSGKPVLTP